MGVERRKPATRGGESRKWCEKGREWEAQSPFPTSKSSSKRAAQQIGKAKNQTWEPREKRFRSKTETDERYEDEILKSLKWHSCGSLDSLLQSSKWWRSLKRIRTKKNSVSKNGNCGFWARFWRQALPLIFSLKIINNKQLFKKKLLFLFYIYKYDSFILFLFSLFFLFF